MPAASSGVVGSTDWGLEVGAPTLPSLQALFSPEHRRDPYPAYGVWRESSPVARLGDQVFVLSRHAECAAVLRDPRFGHAEPGEASPLGRAPEHVPLDEDGKPARSFLRMNPPDHTRLRRLVSKAFSRPMVARLEPRIEQITSELLRAARAACGPVNLIESLAYPLPVMVISELLGIPEGDREQFVHWSHEMARGLDPEFLLPPELQAVMVRARGDFGQYVRRLAETRRRAPGDDLVSALVGVRDSGDLLSDSELISTCILLLIAGHETTVNLIGNGTLALLRHPDQLARLRAEPELIEPAVEELLRYDSPVQLTARSALADAEIDGTHAKRGSIAILLIGAANRDPGAHPRPDELDIGREPGQHLAFGQGPHFCLGAPLARLEAKIALAALTRDADALRLAGEPEWKENLVLRGLRVLPVEFSGQGVADTPR
jgi:cytochrome P450